MGRKAKIRTIDVTVKEWFDRPNGNSYFAGIVTTNYGLPSAKQHILKFQYGYGDHYRDMANELLSKEGIINRLQYDNGIKESYWECYERLGIIARHSKHNDCKKRDVLNYIS